MKSQATLHSAQRNKANYLEAKDAYNARDLERCLAFYASDHQIMSKPTPPGREHIRLFFEASLATWSDIQIVVEHAIAEDALVMGRSKVTATHSDTVMGIPATNRKSRPHSGIFISSMKTGS